MNQLAAKKNYRSNYGKNNRFDHQRKNLNHKMKRPRDLEKEEIKQLNDLRISLGELNPADIVSFEMLPLSNKTLQGLLENGYKEPTKVQRHTLIHSLRELDVVAAAKTGSGKTLAFIIPLLELLYLKLWNMLDGAGAIIITPTRELAYQIFEVINKVGKMHSFSVGLVIGGKDLKHEWTRIQRCNILICTPGRLLQHMTQNPEFEGNNVQILVLDEADECLSLGFLDTMSLILEELPKDRQTLLFSATQTREVEDLIRAGVRDPVFCSAHEHSKTATPKTLTESFIVIEDHDKINFLWSYLKHHKRKKILIFLSTCKQVVFITNLFSKLRVGHIAFYGLHGDMHQLKRMAIYDEFCERNPAVLFATDVAARGLDIPSVDWVLQVDCPEDVKTYIHRAGRTARYSSQGEALLLLTSSQEAPMTDSLQAANIPIEKISVDPDKLKSIQTDVQLMLSKHVSLKEEAERAFKSYLKNVALMKNKTVFDVRTVNMDALAKSYGLPFTPRARFIERKLKKMSLKSKSKKNADDKVSTTTNENLKKTFSLGIDEETTAEDGEIDFLSRSTQNPLAVHEQSADVLNDFVSFAKSNKVIDRYKMAKQLSMGNLQVNKRTVFNEQCVQEESSSTIQSVENCERKTTGINIAEFQEQLKSQDQIDKEEARVIRRKIRQEKLKKRKKREEEEANERENTYEGTPNDSEAEGSDLDAFTKEIIDDLPDPDRIYGDREGSSDESKNSSLESEGEDSSAESEGEESPPGSESDIETKSAPQERNPPPNTKRKCWGEKKAKKEALRVKKARLEAENDLSAISCTEKEDLAMLLLRRQ